MQSCFQLYKAANHHKTTSMTIAQWLKQKRMTLGLTPPELAAKIEVDASYIYYLEAGKRKFNIDLIKKIVAIVEPDEFKHERLFLEALEIAGLQEQYWAELDIEIANWKTTTIKIYENFNGQWYLEGEPKEPFNTWAEALGVYIWEHITQVTPCDNLEIALYWQNGELWTGDRFKRAAWSKAEKERGYAGESYKEVYPLRLKNKDRTCDECDRPLWAKGKCSSHYQEIYRNERRNKINGTNF